MAIDTAELHAYAQRSEETLCYWSLLSALFETKHWGSLMLYPDAQICELPVLLLSASHLQVHTPGLQTHVLSWYNLCYNPMCNLGIWLWGIRLLWQATYLLSHSPAQECFKTLLSTTKYLSPLPKEKNAAWWHKIYRSLFQFCKYTHLTFIVSNTITFYYAFKVK